MGFVDRAESTTALHRMTALVGAQHPPVRADNSDNPYKPEIIELFRGVPEIENRQFRQPPSQGQKAYINQSCKSCRFHDSDKSDKGVAEGLPEALSDKGSTSS